MDDFRPPYVLCSGCGKARQLDRYEVDRNGVITLPTESYCKECCEEFEKKMKKKDQPSLIETWIGFAFILVIIAIFDGSKWITQGIHDLFGITLTTEAFCVGWFILGFIYWLIELFYWNRTWR